MRPLVIISQLVKMHVEPQEAQNENGVSYNNCSSIFAKKYDTIKTFIRVSMKLTCVFCIVVTYHVNPSSVEYLYTIFFAA